MNGFTSGTAEEWHPVAGFEGIYEVSNLGRVRSLDRRVKSPRGDRLSAGKVLDTARKSGRRYQRVSLCANGKRRDAHVHRMVAVAFIPNPENLPKVRHLDDDPDNNAVSNLAWGTDADNMQDRLRNGNNPWASKTHCIRGHEFNEANTRIVPGRNGGTQRECRACGVERYRQARNKREVAK